MPKRERFGKDRTNDRNARQRFRQHVTRRDGGEKIHCVLAHIKLIVVLVDYEPDAGREVKPLMATPTARPARMIPASFNLSFMIYWLTDSGSTFRFSSISVKTEISVQTEIRVGGVSIVAPVRNV